MPTPQTNAKQHIKSVMHEILIGFGWVVDICFQQKLQVLMVKFVLQSVAFSVVRIYRIYKYNEMNGVLGDKILYCKFILGHGQSGLMI